MTRLLFALLLLVGVRSAIAQTTQYDYLYIQNTSSGPEVKVISTEAETRVVRVEYPKGQGTFEPNAKVIMALVQEYESKGWSLLTVAVDGSQIWIMRKPKQ